MGEGEQDSVDLKCFYTRGSYDALHGPGALEALLAPHLADCNPPSSQPAAHKPAPDDGERPMPTFL